MVGTRRRAAAAGGLFFSFTIVLLSAVPAFACSARATAAASTATATAESTIRVTGSGYSDSAPVEIRWRGEQGAVLATATVGADGRFAQEVTVPGDAGEGAFLVTALQHRDDGSVLKSSFAIEVRPTGVATSPARGAGVLSVDQRRSFGSPAPASSTAPWALAPIALAGGFVFVASAMVFARETRSAALARV